MKKLLTIFSIIVLLVITGIFFFYISEKKSMESVSNFKECEESGYPVAESYPRQCRVPDGRMFVEELTNKDDLIIVDYPKNSDEVSSPLIITGKARGFWFFEASFPVELLDNQGNILSTGIAQAQGEWMTEDFVPFSTTLVFDAQLSDKGTLILHKDNPSGLPEHDDKLEINLNFKSKEEIGQRDCKPTGCSGQICSDIDVITTCEFLEEYSCYATAKCERQKTGECGWTTTPELTSCLSTI